MALGYGGHPEWRDMSEYLVHLTDSVDALGSILRDRTIEARSAFGAVRNHERVAATQRVVCFSEIPLDHLTRLASKHGCYGLAFEKRVLRTGGAVPVWYLERGTPMQRRIFELVKEAAYRSSPEPDDFLWTITPFIDYPGIYGQREYKWEWEREWRQLGNLTFDPVSVSFIFAPEHGHDLVRRLWQDGDSGSLAPLLLDAAWPLERIQRVAADREL